MTVFFTPNGSLNIAHDASDLPESVDEGNVSSGAMTRCKNLRLDQKGIAKTRDGSTKLNASAIDTSTWWIEVQSGTRYTFAGTAIYENETSLATGLTSYQWSAIQYNPFNDSSPNIYGLNRVDRKRIEGGAVYEWGIDAPEQAPTLVAGSGSGLSGAYRVKYTYARKAGTVLVSESNPSPASDEISVTSGSIGVDITDPTDSQVTHIRTYRTLSGGTTYFFDEEIALASAYSYGYSFDWEEEDGYESGTGYKFTISSSSATTGSALVSISDTTSAVIKFPPNTATAGYRLASDGIAYRRNVSGSYVAIASQWMTSGAVADYESRATLVSGSTPTGTFGSWQALSSARTWEISTSSGIVTSVFTVEIRLASSGVVLDSATISLEAESTP